MDGVNCNMADSFTFLSFFLPLSLFLLSHLALPFPVQEPQPFCPPFEYCGDLFDIQPPFTAIHKPKCGLYAVNCDDKMKPTIKFEDEGKSYVVKKILYEQSTLVIQDEDISNHSPSDFCNFLYNFTVPPSLLHFHLKSPNHTFVNCNRGHQPLFNDSYMGVYNYTDCEDRIIYYWPEDLPLLHYLSPLQLHHCSVTHFPLSLDLVDPDVPNDLFRLLDFGFGLQWNRTQENGKKPTIKFEGEGRSYAVKEILYEESTLVIQDEEISNHSPSDFCNFLYNFTMPPSPIHPLFLNAPNYTFVNCKGDHQPLFNDSYKGVYNYRGCEDRIIYYWPEDLQLLHHLSPLQLRHCSVTQFPLFPWLDDPKMPNDLFSLLEIGFGLLWNRTPKCKECQEVQKGFCVGNHLSGDYNCFPMPRVIQTLSNQPGLDNPAERNGGHSGEKSSKKKPSIKWKILIGIISTVAGCFLLAGFLFLLIRTKKWKKKTDNAGNVGDVEEFLEIYGSLALRRYKYSDLKKITNSFKDNLGQGAYGGVFKGMLQDGRLVAVKVLNESKGKGEDFINEVSSIGRTYHVNIVSLLGFCSEGSKRALIYEFMPNGSLEKFIYTEKPRQSHPLGWEKLYQIAIGVARGLEYLHRGCNTRILHFDIKPHNILLDQDFCPKISDFGLAKLCPTQNSTISMLGARGTVGFIAPEVYCRSIGGISHKSDVYSYGMMVLEMVGGRKNIDPLVDNTSEVYFPHWIYNRLTTYWHLDLHGYLGLHGIETKVEEETARKMILVGLWCIQTNPTDRPSMSRVVEMLEGSLNGLQMPTQPFLSSSS